MVSLDEVGPKENGFNKFYYRDWCTETSPAKQINEALRATPLNKDPTQIAELRWWLQSIA
jgi:hypothetical protein